MTLPSPPVRDPDRVPNYSGPCAASAPRACRVANGFCNDWFLRGYKRTFSPFHHGVVTAYALEVGAAGQGDNRDPSLSACGAVRYPIHEIPPDFFTPNSEPQLLFHSRVGCGTKPPPQRKNPPRRTGAGWRFSCSPSAPNDQRRWQVAV